MDGEEDFYLALGCSPASSPEQIMAEYRVRSVATRTRNTTIFHGLIYQFSSSLEISIFGPNRKQPGKEKLVLGLNPGNPGDLFRPCTSHPRAKAAHPDKQEGSQEATGRFQRLQRAKETLVWPPCSRVEVIHLCRWTRRGGRCTTGGGSRGWPSPSPGGRRVAAGAGGRPWGTPRGWACTGPRQGASPPSSAPAPLQHIGTLDSMFGRNDRMVGGEGVQGRGEEAREAREASRAPLWTPPPSAATRHTVSDQELLRQSFRNYQI